MKKSFFLGLLFLILIAVPVHAAQVYWTDWTSRTFGTPGSASGTITLSGGGIAVSYTGEVINVGDQGNWNYPAYMKTGIVDNTPTPVNESIPLRGGNSIVNTITFSQPVINPIFAVQRLGSGGDLAIYEFSSPYTLLNQGPGHWGGTATSLSQVGNDLYGREGNGIIQFTGTYSSLSWTVPDGENYHMFTVGVVGTPNPSVPLPAAAWLFGPGLVGLIGLKSRFKN